jgi:hypothetical protein
MKTYMLFQGSKDDEQNNKKYRYAMINIDETSLGFDRYDVTSGIPFAEWNENIIATYEYKKGYPITDYALNILAWFTVTERFIKLLIDLKIEGLQFHSIKLRCLNKDNLDVTVYLVNILNVIEVAAIDLEKSKYFYYELDDREKVLSVREYCLKHSLIKDSDIFRIQESMFYTSSIFISEKVKNAIEENGITGCVFSEVEVV